MGSLLGLGVIHRFMPSPSLLTSFTDRTSSLLPSDCSAYPAFQLGHSEASDELMLWLLLVAYSLRLMDWWQDLGFLEPFWKLFSSFLERRY